MRVNVKERSAPGHTNAAIAATLFISPKTVDHHVSADEDEMVEVQAVPESGVAGIAGVVVDRDGLPDLGCAVEA